jgi:hypothetical protein
LHPYPRVEDVEASLGNEVGETHLECVVYESIGKEERKDVGDFVKKRES